MKTKILIVDDEKEIITFMKDYLEDVGYKVLTAYNGKDAISALAYEPCIIILDVMMPGMNGFELCELIRKKISCPIIFLSARDREEDRIKGLLVGGDDYLVKPFSLKELHARIIAHLRREQRNDTVVKKHIYFGQLMIDLDGHEVYIQDKKIPFTAREFQIIELLSLHPGQVFSREQIYEKLWGFDAFGDSSTVTEHIKKIRRKLNERDVAESYISTVWGVGYKWNR